MVFTFNFLFTGAFLVFSFVFLHLLSFLAFCFLRFPVCFMAMVRRNLKKKKKPKTKHSYLSISRYPRVGLIEKIFDSFYQFFVLGAHKDLTLWLIKRITSSKGWANAPFDQSEFWINNYEKPSRWKERSNRIFIKAFRMF